MTIVLLILENLPQATYNLLLTSNKSVLEILNFYLTQHYKSQPPMDLWIGYDLIGDLHVNMSILVQSCCEKELASILIWRHAAFSVLKPLVTVDLYNLCFIPGDRYNILHEKVGWPSLLYILKTSTGKLPPYLSDLLEFYYESYMTHLFDSLALKHLQVYTELNKLAFSMWCFSLPNKLHR